MAYSTNPGKDDQYFETNYVVRGRVTAVGDYKIEYAGDKVFDVSQVQRIYLTRQAIDNPQDTVSKELNYSPYALSREVMRERSEKSLQLA